MAEQPAVPDPFLAAVRAVKHSPTCGTIQRIWCDSPYCTPEECDRDERIAKGLKAACEIAGELLTGWEEAALHEFTEASRG